MEVLAYGFSWLYAFIMAFNRAYRGHIGCRLVYLPFIASRCLYGLLRGFDNNDNGIFVLVVP